MLRPPTECVEVHNDHTIGSWLATKRIHKRAVTRCANTTGIREHFHQQQSRAATHPVNVRIHSTTGLHTLPSGSDWIVSSGSCVRSGANYPLIVKTTKLKRPFVDEMRVDNWVIVCCLCAFKGRRHVSLMCVIFHGREPSVYKRRSFRSGVQCSVSAFSGGTSEVTLRDMRKKRVVVPIIFSGDPYTTWLMHVQAMSPGIDRFCILHSIG